MTAHRIWIIALFNFMLLSVGNAVARAGARASVPATPQPVSTTQPSARPADQLDVLEAVFRHEFTHNASGQQQNVAYFFLELDAGADPPAELLARFKNDKPGVLPVSMAGPSRRNGVKHKEDGKSGLIFRITTITWLDTNTAQLEGGYYEAGLSASGNTYRVERRNGKWTLTDDTMNWISMLITHL